MLIQTYKGRRYYATPEAATPRRSMAAGLYLAGLSSGLLAFAAMVLA
jgi:hypothetical protein